MRFFKISEDEFLLRKRDIEMECRNDLKSFERKFGGCSSLCLDEKLLILFRIVRWHERELRKLTFWFKYLPVVINSIVVLIIMILLYYIKRFILI